MPTSFKFVQDVFERVYHRVRQEMGSKYLEDQGAGYLVPTRAHLASVKWMGPAIHDRPKDGVVGPPGGDAVAWLLDHDKLGLIQINDGVSEEELLALANRFYENP